GPPGPELPVAYGVPRSTMSPDLPHVIRHRPLIVLSLVASGSRRLGPWCAYWSDPSRNARPFLISGFPEFAQGVGYGVPGTPGPTCPRLSAPASWRWSRPLGLQCLDS